MQRVHPNDKRPDHGRLVEVGIRRQAGMSISKIAEEMDLSRSEVGRQAKLWKTMGEAEKKDHSPIDLGNLTDFDWSFFERHGLCLEDLPWLLEVWYSGGCKPLTVDDARFLRKLKEAAADLPPSHANSLLYLYWVRAPLERQGQSVDNSDIWLYLASGRWRSRKEDEFYLTTVSWGQPYLDPLPPNLRDPEKMKRIQEDHQTLATFVSMDIHSGDPLYHAARNLWVSWLPLTPWDPRLPSEGDLARHNEDNEARLRAQFGLMRLRQQDQETAEEEGHNDATTQ